MASENELGKLLWSYACEGTLTDCEVQCKSETWKCHRAVLCAHSIYFKKVFMGSFKEALTSTLTIKDEAPEALGHLLKFLYLGTVDEPSKTTPRDNLIELASTFALGDRFMSPGLKSLVAKKFATCLETKYLGAELVIIATSGLIRKIYDSTPAPETTLRDQIANYVAKQVLGEWSTRKLLFENANFKKILNDTPDFAMQLLMAIGKTPAPSPYGYASYR